MSQQPATTAAAAAAAGGPDLLLEMRRATRRAHNIANALILSKLAVVLTDPSLYAQALGSFLPVYSELEAQMRAHAKTPGLQGVIAAVQAGVPSRAAAMQADLAHLLGPDWSRVVQSSPAAAAYAAHLRDLGRSEPLLLLPYVFSMHVPILLGFLGQRIQRALQLPDDRGLAFFQAKDKAGTLAQLREAVRQAGREDPQLAHDPQLRRRVVDEAVVQFSHNNAVVAGFRVGWRAVARALLRALVAVRAFVLAGLLAVAVAAWLRRAGGGGSA